MFSFISHLRRNENFGYTKSEYTEIRAQSWPFGPDFHQSIWISGNRFRNHSFWAYNHTNLMFINKNIVGRVNFVPSFLHTKTSFARNFHVHVNGRWRLTCLQESWIKVWVPKYQEMTPKMVLKETTWGHHELSVNGKIFSELECFFFQGQIG